jgi:hypothetical protein
MAQGDMNIANQGFPAFRADLNDQLEALVTNSSGATAPATTFPHQWWLDTSTTPSTLRQRNAANDAWIVVGLLNQSTNTFNLPVAQGGTGRATLTSNNLILGAGTGAVNFVAPGTSGNLLTSDGTTWKSEPPPPAGGKVLQVVSTTKTDVFSTSSGSWVDITGLSVSITPANADSKFVIFSSLNMSNTSIDRGLYFRLMRDSTPVGVGDVEGSRTSGSGMSQSFGGRNMWNFSTSHVDLPNKTSALTYKLQSISLDSGTVVVNRSTADTNNATYLRVASSITVMEIAA